MILHGISELGDYGSGNIKYSGIPWKILGCPMLERPWILESKCPGY